MAKYTREEYEAGLEKAKAAQDKGAINYFQGKLKDLDVENNTEKLFRAKSKAMAANDDGAVEYFNKRIEKEISFVTYLRIKLFPERNIVSNINKFNINLLLLNGTIVVKL